MRSTRDLSSRTRWLVAGGIHQCWRAITRLGAITPDTAWGRRFGAFGQASCIAFPPGAIFGEQWIRVGEQTLIGPDVTLSAGMAPGQQMITDPVVRIGDRCMIGRGSSIVGHLSIDIGDDIWTGPHVYITDQNHSYVDIDVPIGRQWPVDAGVRIGSGSWLGTGVVVLPGTSIGSHVVVAAGSVVRGDIPDRCVIAGSPARIVRSYDEPSRSWVTGPPRPAAPRQARTAR